MSQEVTAPPSLEVEHLSKSFARTRALASVDLSIAPAEVHALLGQNGSGKSTLIKVLSGYHSPDPGGVVRVAGQELPFGDPVQSYRLGCRFVQQDLGLINVLSVVDNMALGSGFPTCLGTIRGKRSIEQAKFDLGRLGLDIDPRAPVSGLSASERTGVAVARALREDPQYPPKLLVLDEPTATLPVDEVDALLGMVGRLAATGVGVLYVTHHLGEVFRIARRVSVFRDGIVVGSGLVEQFDHDSLVELLAGVELIREELSARQRKSSRHSGEAPVLSVSGLEGGPVRGVSLEAHPGEIVGLAGLDGSGRDFILGSIFGSRERVSGEVQIKGTRMPAGRPDLAISRGVAYLAPDRKLGGGVMTMTAMENMTLPGLRPFWKRLVINRRMEREHTRGWFERLSVRPADALTDPLAIFSGGNQQKILFAKWLSQGPAVFLLDEPTQGVDVGAKAELHQELVGSAEAGAAVVISSSDLEELADLCDRVLVFIDGRLSAELSGSDLTETSITRRFMPAAAVPAPTGDT